MDNSNAEELADRIKVPVFNPAFVPIKLDANTVHIRAGPHSGPVVTISDGEESGSLTEIIDLINGDRTTEQILESIDSDDRDEVINLLMYLLEKNVLYDANDECVPDVRQYFAVKPYFNEENREKLENTHLTVISVGELGRHVVESADKMGVGSIKFISPFGDDDETSSSKYSAIENASEEDIEVSVSESDAVLYLADRPLPSLVELINEITFEHRKPWMVGQIQGFDGFVGPTMFPGETGCYECFLERSKMNVVRPEGYDGYRQFAAKNGMAQAAIPGFGQLITGYLTLDLLHLLAFGQAFTAGRVIHLSAIDLSVEVNDVLKLPRCSVCGKHPGDDVSRFVSNDDIARIASVSWKKEEGENDDTN